jgi:hypothetical protein
MKAATIVYIVVLCIPLKSIADVLFRVKLAAKLRKKFESSVEWR